MVMASGHGPLGIGVGNASGIMPVVVIH